MKRILSVILAVMMVAAMLSVCAFADDAAVWGDVKHIPYSDEDRSVTLDFFISGNPGIAGINMPMSYDTEKLSFNYGDISSSLFSGYDCATRVQLDSAKNVTENGTMFTLTFTVKGGATGVADVSLSLNDAYDEARNPVSVSVSGGQIIIDEPPATEPPATEPPATEPPATEPPATEPPATQPPVVTPAPTAPGGTSPRTGDSLFIGLCVLAVCGGAAFVIVSKKKSAEK